MIKLDTNNIFTRRKTCSIRKFSLAENSKFSLKSGLKLRFVVLR